MTTATPASDTEPVTDNGDTGGPEIEHCFCKCSPERSLCGIEWEDAQEGAEDWTGDPCVVCVDLEHKPCERCGR